jgi:hypothetical protein
MNSSARAARLVSLGKECVRAMKKTVHKTRRSRPFTTVSHGADRETALALLADAGGEVATNTARYYRLHLTGDEAAALLRIDTPVGPVKDTFPVRTRVRAHKRRKAGGIGRQRSARARGHCCAAARE